MNTCKCGGEVFLDYRQGYYTGQHWYAICGDCGNEIPLNANNRIDAIREWNNMQVDEPQEQTNEEWFCTLPTEEKAKRIINIAVNSDCDYRTIIEWLKQPHREENEK